MTTTSNTAGTAHFQPATKRLANRYAGECAGCGKTVEANRGILTGKATWSLPNGRTKSAWVVEHLPGGCPTGDGVRITSPTQTTAPTTADKVLAAAKRVGEFGPYGLGLVRDGIAYLIFTKGLSVEQAVDVIFTDVHCLSWVEGMTEDCPEGLYCDGEVPLVDITNEGEVTVDFGPGA